MVSHTVCAWVSSQPHRTSQVSSFVGNEAKRNTNFAVTATHNNAIDNYCEYVYCVGYSLRMHSLS